MQVQNLQYKRLEKQCKSSFHNNTINLKFNNNYKKINVEQLVKNAY